MKRVVLAGAAIALAISGLGVMTPRAYAAGQTCVWEGTGGDNLFSTAANWSGCGGSVPLDNDTINFPYANVNDNQVITNDIAATAFRGITISAGPDGQSGKDIAISALHLADGATIGTPGHLSSGAGLYISIATSMNVADWVNVTGAGAATLGHYVQYKNIVIPGVFTIGANAYYDYRSGDDFSALVVSAEGYAAFNATGTTNTFSKPITLNGGMNTALSFGGDCKTASMYGCQEYNPTTWTVSGPITANALSYIDTTENTTVKFTGTVNDKSRLTNGLNADGSFQFGEIAEVRPVTTVKFEGDNVAQSIDIRMSEIGILTGKRQNATVFRDGVLKGTGTVTGSIFVSEGGIVAPGNSPGCLTSNTLSLDGEYQFELGGTEPCVGYDQLKVLNTSNVQLPVILGTKSLLTTLRFDNYTPKQGDVFTIINQEGGRAVSGTFMGLPEGTNFTQNGIVFKISYVGGDGNDVTLTVQNTPTAPDTGVQILKANPVIIAVATIASAIALLALAKHVRR